MSKISIPDFMVTTNQSIDPIDSLSSTHLLHPLLDLVSPNQQNYHLNHSYYTCIVYSSKTCANHLSQTYYNCNRCAKILMVTIFTLLYYPCCSCNSQRLHLYDQHYLMITFDLIPLNLFFLISLTLIHILTINYALFQRCQN